MPEMTEVLETRRAMFWATLVAECAGETEVTTERVLSALVRTETVTTLCGRLGANASALREAVDGERKPPFDACRDRVLRDLESRGIGLATAEHRALVQRRPLDARARAVFDTLLPTERQFRLSPLEVLLAFVERNAALAELLSSCGLDASSLRSRSGP